jgi:hypothetical protein
VRQYSASLALQNEQDSSNDSPNHNADSDWDTKDCLPGNMPRSSRGNNQPRSTSPQGTKASWDEKASDLAHKSDLDRKMAGCSAVFAYWSSLIPVPKRTDAPDQGGEKERLNHKYTGPGYCARLMFRESARQHYGDWPHQ